MPPKTRFEPDATLGELRLLLRFGEIEPEDGANARGPMTILSAQTGHSKEVIYAAFDRIRAAFGVEVVEADAHGVMRITEAGHNLGRVAWIAKALTDLAALENTDQAGLLQLMSDIGSEIVDRDKSGRLGALKNRN